MITLPSKTIYYFNNGQWVKNSALAYHAGALFGPLRGICIVPSNTSTEEIDNIVKENLGIE